MFHQPLLFKTGLILLDDFSVYSWRCCHHNPFTDLIFPQMENITALTSIIFLFLLNVGLVWFRFKGDSFPCCSGTRLLSFLFLPLAFKNLCEMLHRKLHQVGRPAAKYFHRVSLQQLFQTSRYLHSTHLIRSEVTGLSLMVHDRPAPNLSRYSDLGRM